LNGKEKMDNKTLAKIAGSEESVVVVLLKELKDNGVYSETEDGVIYNRRMAREHSLSDARAEAGKKGMERRWAGKQSSITKHNKTVCYVTKENNKAITKSPRKHNKPITEPDNKPLTDSASASASSYSSSSIEECIHPEDQRLVQLLVDLIQQNNPKSRVSQMSENAQRNWLDQCRLLREMDKRTPEEIEMVIRWSQEDSFWKSNILSMPTLREKFDRLWVKSRSVPLPMDGPAKWLEKQKEKENE
jgi:hypothetical protein